MDVDIFDWWLLTRCNTRPFYIPHWRIDPAFLHPLTAFLWSPLYLLLIRERTAHTLRHPWSAGRHPSDGCWAALGPSWHPNLSTNENIWEITDVFCPWRLPEVIKHRFHGGQLWNTQDLNRKELSRRAAALEHTGRERERAFMEGCSGTHRTWRGKSFHRGLLWNTQDLDGKEPVARLWAGATWVSKPHPWGSFPACQENSRICKITVDALTLLRTVLWGGRGPYSGCEAPTACSASSFPLSGEQGRGCSAAEAAELMKDQMHTRPLRAGLCIPSAKHAVGTPTTKNHMWYDTARYADTQQIHRGLPGIDREKAFRCF